MPSGTDHPQNWFGRGSGLRIPLALGRSVARGSPLAKFDCDAVLEARVYPRNINSFISTGCIEEDDGRKCGITWSFLRDHLASLREEVPFRRAKVPGIKRDSHICDKLDPARDVQRTVLQFLGTQRACRTKE